MAAPRIVQIILQALDKTTGVLKSAETGVERYSKNATRFLKALAATAVAAALGKFFKDSIQEATEAERTMVRLGVAVTNTGNDFGKLSPSLERAIDGVKRMSTASDEDLRDALTNLITITGDVAGSTANLGLAADLSAARQIDLGTASDLVAKAMNGNTTALNKLGFAGKDAETVLGNLRQSVGGFAAGEAKTFEGQIKNLTRGWDDFKEAVGRAILSGGELGTGVGKLTGLLATLEGFIVENEEAISQFVSGLVSVVEVIGKGVILGLRGLVILFQSVKSGIGDLLVSIGTLFEKGGAILAKFGIDVGDGAAKALKGAGQRMQDESNAALARILLGTKDWEGKITTEHGAAATKRTRLTKEQLDAREKATKEHAKKLEELNEEIAVKTLMLEEGLTEQQAKQFVERQKNLGEYHGNVVASTEEAYGKLDQLNLLLAAGFDKKVIPSVQRTTVEFKDLKAAGVAPASTALQDLAVTLGLTVEETEDLLRGTDDLAASFEDWAVGIVGVGQELGLLDDNAAAAIDSILGIKVAFEQAKEAGDAAAAAGKSFLSGFLGDPSAALGMIGGLTGLLKGVFGGDSPAVKAAKEAIRKNTDAILENSRNLGDLLRLQTPGAQFAGVKSALEAAEKIGGLSEGLQFMEGGPQRVLEELLKRGFTMRDLEEVAKDLGITLTSKASGKILAGLPELLAQLQATQFTQFGPDFASQLTRIETGLQIGAIRPEEEFSQLLQALNANQVTAITDALAGLDVTSAEGRQAAVVVLRDLFSGIGELAPEQLGELTGKEFLDAIERLVGILADPERAIAGIQIPTPEQPPIEFAGAPEFAAAVDGLTIPMDASVDLLGSIDQNIARLVEQLGPAPAAIPGDGATEEVPPRAPFDPVALSLAIKLLTSIEAHVARMAEVLPLLQLAATAAPEELRVVAETEQATGATLASAAALAELLRVARETPERSQVQLNAALQLLASIDANVARTAELAARLELPPIRAPEIPAGPTALDHPTVGLEHLARLLEGRSVLPDQTDTVRLLEALAVPATAAADRLASIDAAIAGLLEATAGRGLAAGPIPEELRMLAETERAGPDRFAELVGALQAAPTTPDFASVFGELAVPMDVSANLLGSIDQSIARLTAVLTRPAATPAGPEGAVPLGGVTLHLEQTFHGFAGDPAAFQREMVEGLLRALREAGWDDVYLQRAALGNLTRVV